MNFIILIACYGLFCAGLMHIMKSMDLDAWMAWVPGLNLYLLIRNTWGSVYFWILCLLAGNCLLLSQVFTANGHPLSVTLLCMEVLLGMVWLMSCLHIAASFNKGAGMGCLLAIAPWMGIWMLSGRYTGIVPSLSNTNHKEVLWS